MVKNILEGVGGNLYIQSERGTGTCFTLTMPLTLANMECVRFKVGDYRDVRAGQTGFPVPGL